MKTQSPRWSLSMAVALCAALAAPGGAACTGDCSGNGEVTVDELIVGVNMALGTTPVANCMIFDANGDGEVTVNEIVAAVNNALTGCAVTPTPTPVTPGCGNGAVEFDRGETCDDGNTIEGDACPENCMIAACRSSGSTFDVDIHFAPPAGVDLAGITVFVRYPDGIVRIPGTANDAAVQNSLSNLPDNGFSTPNDLDYALRLVVFAPDSSPIAADRLATIRLDTCADAAAPQIGQFQCRVESAADTNNESVTTATCSVAVQ